MRKMLIHRSITVRGAALCLALATLACAALFGCTKPKKSFSDTYFDCFDSYAALTVIADSQDEFDTYNAIFSETVYKYHKLLDAYNSYDGVVNIHSLNTSAPTDPTQVSQELFDFLSDAKRAYTLTEGYTSLTFGAVTSIWKQAISYQIPPSPELLATASKHTDVSALVLDSGTLSVTFLDSELRLDVGALAKGYVADVAATRLIDAGCESFLIDLGGTLKAHGQKDNAKSWRAGITDPRDQGKNAFSIDISGKALSTSGSYHRGFEHGGVRYHHIIDPITLQPQNTFVSVSVLCPSGMDADALSTALFCMSLEDGHALVESLKNTDAVWMLSDGSTHTTSGISAQ